MSTIFEGLQESGRSLEREISNTVGKAVLKIRTAVSKDKNRFINDDFNLDLTYITNRIIAMGYPSTGEFESNWRNSMPDVKRFFETYHKDKYLVLNLTEKAYDITYFNNRVHHLGWPDHHAPSVGLLIYCIQIIHQWLSQDPDNVVAIHCAAGRGRTGTLICSYLVSTMMYEGQRDAALKLFATQRSSIGEGLTVPSQIRYVDYVSKLATKVMDIQAVQNPRVLSLNRIMMRPIPRGSTGWTPTVEVYCVNMPLQPVLLFSTKDRADARTFNNPVDPAAIIDTNNTVVCGDILVRVYGTTELYTKELFASILDKPSFRFSFHTSFVDGYFIDFGKLQLDETNGPLKSPMYPNDFTIRLMFGEASQQQPQQQARRPAPPVPQQSTTQQQSQPLQPQQPQQPSQSSQPLQQPQKSNPDKDTIIEMYNTVDNLQKQGVDIIDENYQFYVDTLTKSNLALLNLTPSDKELIDRVMRTHTDMFNSKQQQYQQQQQQSSFVQLGKDQDSNIRFSSSNNNNQNVNQQPTIISSFSGSNYKNPFEEDEEIVNDFHQINRR